jgi:hypothetical protein
MLPQYPPVEVVGEIALFAQARLLAPKNAEAGFLRIG